MADPRDEIIAQQQKLIVAQQQLIAELQQRLAEQAAEFEARSAAMEAEMRRLQRELLGPKTERQKVPPVERDDPAELSEEELRRRREEIARKRRENALAKQAALATEDADHPVPDAMKRCPRCGGSHFSALPPEESTTYEYIPGRFVRRRHRREKLVSPRT